MVSPPQRGSPGCQAAAWIAGITPAKAAYSSPHLQSQLVTGSPPFHAGCKASLYPAFRPTEFALPPISHAQPSHHRTGLFLIALESIGTQSVRRRALTPGNALPGTSLHRRARTSRAHRFIRRPSSPMTTHYSPGFLGEKSISEISFSVSAKSYPNVAFATCSPYFSATSTWPASYVTSSERSKLSKP